MVGVLKYDAHTAQQVGSGYLGPVEEETTALRLVQAGHQAGQRSLARAVVADESRHARGEESGSVFEYRGLPLVGEGHALHAEAVFRLAGFRRRSRTFRQMRAGVVHMPAAQAAGGTKPVVLEQTEIALRHHFAFFHYEHAVGHAFQPVQAVIHHEDGHAALLEHTQAVRQLHGGFRVEVGGRLVQNKNLGFLRHDGRQPHLLLLPFGKFVDGLPEYVPDAEGACEGTHLLAGLFGRQAAPFVHEGQLVFHAQREELLFRILKQRAAEARHILERQVERTFAVHQHAAFKAALEPARAETVGKAHQRAFAASAPARDEHHFAGMHLEIDAAHGGLFRKGVGVGDVFKT